MSESKKLLSCPFCGDTEDGGVHTVVNSGNFDVWYGVMCENCGAEINQFDTLEEAIEAWNVRTVANIPMAEAWSAIPENVDTAMFWQAQEGDCCCGNHVTRDEHYYCNRCGRELLWEGAK